MLAITKLSPPSGREDAEMDQSSPEQGTPGERGLLTELDQAADASGLEVHVRTRRGSPARELASIAAEFSADALVIGAPRHFWHHLIGSGPSRLAPHARRPVV